jgi:hypothetical protein
MTKTEAGSVEKEEPRVKNIVPLNVLGFGALSLFRNSLPEKVFTNK